MNRLRILLVGALAATGISVVMAPAAEAASATVSGFSQCANGTGTAVTCTGGWINGAIQGSNSHYAEDNVVPQRVQIALPADNLEHSLTFTYQDRKGSVHAYDSLATYNKTVTDADPCGGLAASLCSGTPDTIPMTADPAPSIPPAATGISTAPAEHDLDAVDRRWTMFGGDLTTDTVVGHSSPASGDDLVTVTVRFKNPTPTTARTAILLFGGHLAVGGPNTADRAWGEDLGASSVSGGPYSFKLEKVDGNSTGAITNSIQAGAAAPLAPAAFTVTKSVNPTTAAPGGTVTYTVTVRNTGPQTGFTTFADDFNDAVAIGAVTTVPTGGTCTATTTGNKVLNCTTSPIAPGATQVFTYTGTMPTTFTGTPGGSNCAETQYAVNNTATITGGNVTIGAGPSSATVCVNAVAAFTVTKAVSAGPYAPGGSITYTVTVKNTGSAPGATTWVDDFDDRLAPSDAVSTPVGASCSPTEDAGNELFDCPTSELQPGASQTFVYTATIPATFSSDDVAGTDGCSPGSFAIKNRVTVSGEAKNVTICVPAAPVLTVAKTANASTVAPGAPVEYTVTVSNSGTAPGSLTFTDNYDDRLDPTVPAGCTDSGVAFTCTTGTIEPGESQSFVYTASMPSTFTGQAGGGACTSSQYLVRNDVTVAGQLVTRKDICVTAAPSFTITKEADPTKADPGQTVTYTITVTNNGTAAGTKSFVDNYDDRLDPTVPAGCTDSGVSFSCTTGTLNAGQSQTFIYTAVMPTTFSGASGVSPCAPGEYSVGNRVLVGTAVVAEQTVCVAASARYTVTKVVDDTTGIPGQTIEYKVTVKNTGEVAGVTTVVDDYDDRLTPTVPNGCSLVTVSGNKTMSCTTGSLAPGASQTFTYTAVLPASYTGPSGGGDCADGSFSIANSATLVNGTSASVEVCVAAAPRVSVTKSGSLEYNNAGEQIITYTLSYANTGAAEAQDVVVTDPVPPGTAFVSCTGGCAIGTDSARTIRWELAPIAPLTGAGTLVLKVRVTTNQACTISNTAAFTVGSGPSTTTNTVTTNVTPEDDPSTARSNGSATGISLTTSGLLDLVGPLFSNAFTSGNTLAISRSNSNQSGPGGPAVDSSRVLSVKIPSNGSLVDAGVLTTTSASSVTGAPAEARQTTTAEVAGLCLIPVAGICTVKSDTVRAVATTMANGSYAGVSTAGSTIENLRVVNTAVPVNLNQTTTIPLNPLIFGPGSYVAINERTGTSGLRTSDNKYVADQSVAMIHVKITGLLKLQAVEIFVAQATAHSEFAKTLVCSGATNRSVSGHAYVARLYTGPVLADLLLGYTQISPLGGAESESVAEVVIPRYGVIANAKAAHSSSAGSLGATSTTSRSWAEVAGDGTKPACVLSYVTNCVAKATLIRAEANSTARSTGSISTSAGTQFLNLSVFGLPIKAQPAANTTLVLPGIGFIILNEQFCDNGGPSSGTCTGNPHSGITVRALRVVITVANNILGLTPGIELVVSEAHADSLFRQLS